jgi:hypothetical protein
MMPDSDDFVLAYMRKHNIKLTRQNYLDIAFLGDPPDNEDDLPELPAGLVDDFPLTQQDSTFLKKIGISTEVIDED